MRAKSRLEGQQVELMASGMEYSIFGRINRVLTEGPKSWEKYFYELETKDGFLYLINVDEVCWISTKKRKYNHLKVVQLHDIK